MTRGNETARPAPFDVRACRILSVDLPPEQPAKRIVHDLDGIDQAVEPNRVLLTGSALWAAWLDHRPGVVPEVLVGLGTSGIIPTIAVAIASGLPYHLAWPYNHGAGGADPPPEPGTRRGELLASGRLRGRRVLVVDDHVIHGYTLASFISALRDEAADVVGVLCLVEDGSGTGRHRVESTGVSLCTVSTL